MTNPPVTQCPTCGSQDLRVEVQGFIPFYVTQDGRMVLDAGGEEGDYLGLFNNGEPRYKCHVCDEEFDDDARERDTDS